MLELCHYDLVITFGYLIPANVFILNEKLRKKKSFDGILLFCYCFIL